MKNRTLVTCLRQFNPELIVSIRAELQNGCEEIGNGRGEYEGNSFSQDYTISWNHGHLIAGEYSGYTVADVIKVLLEKPLSKIGHEDFNLRLGELTDGYTEYETTWEAGTPEELPEDSDLYRMMEHGEAHYEWFNAAYVEFEVHYKNQEGEAETVSFVLNEDEIDKKSDSLDKTIKKAVPKKKALKRK